MFNNYLNDINKHNVECITVNSQLNVTKTSNNLFNLKKGDNLLDWHLFFNTLTVLDHNTDNKYSFSCIHFEIDNTKYIVDIYYYMYSDKDNLLIIQNLTSHYNNYQTTAQVKNETVIKSERLKSQNTLLKEQEDFKTRFIANFNHELREPLSGIISFSEFLEETELNYQQKNYLDLIKSSSSHLKKMIDEILLFSTLQTKELNLNKEVFNLNELINDIKEIYKVKTEQKGLKFNYIEKGKCNNLIVSDKIKLRQIITNLITNAIKYTDYGEIDFKVFFNQKRGRKQNITIEISDTGKGIEQHQLNDIFKSFTKFLPESDTNSSSFGLGLSITKQLVDLFKGKIEVVSTPKKGSTFIVNFNLEIQIDKNSVPKNLKKELEEKGKLKVLLVDDSEVIQLTLLKIFSKFKNIDLDILTDPSTLIDTIEITEYNLILMDINLKKHNGLNLSKKIRSHRHRELKKTPIIAVTGSVFNNDLLAYKKAGIDYTLKKPFIKEELYEALILTL